MTLGRVVAAALTALATGLALGTPSAQAAGPVTSTIYSPSAKVCVDVPGGTTDDNRNLVPATCNGSAEQQFTFTPVHDANNTQPNTYVVVNRASGLCLFKFRFEIRQANCAGVSPYPAGWTWVLYPLDPAAHTYLFVPGYTTPAIGRCLAVGATTSLLPTPFCNAADPAQAFVVTGLS
jgi:hypothetical protein